MADDAGQSLSLFQIENLVLTRSPFLLLSVETFDPIVELRPLFKAAVEVPAEGLMPYLKSKNIPFEHPLVLVCKSGSVSRNAAKRLEKAGFKNVYHANGGVEGLASELES